MAMSDYPDNPSDSWLNYDSALPRFAALNRVETKLWFKFTPGFFFVWRKRLSSVTFRYFQGDQIMKLRKAQGQEMP